MEDIIIDPADTGLFSLREAAVLSRLAEDKVRREVERKIVEPVAVEEVGAARRLLFDEAGILYFAILSGFAGGIELAPEMRAKARKLIAHCSPSTLLPARRRGEDAWRLLHRDGILRAQWIERVDREWTETINRVVRIDWSSVLADVGPRVDLYRRRRGRVRRDDAILGGEPVFAGTRLAVRHIGGMRLKGEPVARIVEDHPELSPEDVAFAALFAEANPPVGRPRTAGDAAA